jgi:hypothetical protein
MCLANSLELRGWNKIARAERVKEFLTRKLLSTAHQLIFHYGDTCHGASESRCSQR